MNGRSGDSPVRDCAVVIATHNRCAALAQTLERLCELPERPPIVVVDNGSTEDTAALCGSFAGVRCIPLARNLGAAARTVGVLEAGTAYVAFCDDDCYWSPGSLSRAVQRFERFANVAVLNGRVLVGPDDRADPACVAMRGAQTDQLCAGVPIAYFMAGASIMRASAFLQAGGYHVRYFMGAEESLLSIDLAARGWALWYCDDLVLHHRPSPVNRNPDARRRLMLRNRLWTVLLRRSFSSAARELARYAQMARTDRVARAALTEAIAGLPWVIRERRVIPRELERRIEAFDPAPAQ